MSLGWRRRDAGCHPEIRPSMFDALHCTALHCTALHCTEQCVICNHSAISLNLVLSPCRPVCVSSPAAWREEPYIGLLCTGLNYTDNLGTMVPLRHCNVQCKAQCNLKCNLKCNIQCNVLCNVQCNAQCNVQCNTQCTILCSVLYVAVKCTVKCKVQYALHCTALHIICSAIYSAQCTGGYLRSDAAENGPQWEVLTLLCSALHCTALHCTALHCRSLNYRERVAISFVW
jgi:hypothetical protein